MAVRVGFEMRKIARKWLLELASIAKVSKTIQQKWKGLISKVFEQLEKAAVQIVGFDLEKMERVAVRKRKLLMI